MIAMEQGTASGAREAWPVAALWVLPDFTGRGRESSGWRGTGRPIWLLASCKQGAGGKRKEEENLTQRRGERRGGAEKRRKRAAYSRPCTDLVVIGIWRRSRGKWRRWILAWRGLRRGDTSCVRPRRFCGEYFSGCWGVGRGARWRIRLRRMEWPSRKDRLPLRPGAWCW